MIDIDVIDADINAIVENKDELLSISIQKTVDEGANTPFVNTQQHRNSLVSDAAA